MSDKTNIQWCDMTWNPWRGCTKVSPGCTNCYAEKLVTTRLGGQWGKGKPRQRASQNILNGPAKWNKKPWICDGCGNNFAEPHPIMMKCECGCSTLHRARVFLGSLMDIFDPEVPIDWFADALETVKQCTELDFLLVTKRPELFMDRMQKTGDKVTSNNEWYKWLCSWIEGKAPKNVWVITSAEDQKRLDERVPHLLSIPAAVHGLSCEPLLGPLNLSDTFLANIRREPTMAQLWVIAGGESGPGARACDAQWIRNIQFQCNSAGVPYFCKQLGAHTGQTWSVGPGQGVPVAIHDKKGGNPAEWPEDMRVREWPKSRA